MAVWKQRRCPEDYRITERRSLSSRRSILTNDTLNQHSYLSRICAVTPIRMPVSDG
jgi:hypothetical protein